MECRAILTLLQSERDERGWVGHAVDGGGGGGGGGVQGAEGCATHARQTLIVCIPRRYDCRFGCGRQARGSIPRCPLANVLMARNGRQQTSLDPPTIILIQVIERKPTPGKASDREIDSVATSLSYTRVAVALASASLSINHSWPLHGTKQRPRQPHSR